MASPLYHLRRFRRSFRVARTGLRIYLAYKMTQRKVRGMSREGAEQEWERRHEDAAERLYRLAVDLKGLYIKLGQFISTRSDMVPAAYVRSLSRLQDKVPARTASEVRAIVEEQLGQPLTEVFTWFDDTPLGAASLAQVHRATLHDGRPVVVKVQYPEVGALVRLDLRNLRTIVGLVARREPNFDFRAVVTEIGQQVPLELNFVREAEMTRRVGANLAELDDIVVPKVVNELVREKVLVTEYIDGSRILEHDRLAGSGTDPVKLAQSITAAFGQQIMVDGLFQADPHPGNILALEGGRAALLDFGLTKELPEQMRIGFARLVVASGNRDPEAIQAAFGELGVKTRSDDPGEVVRLMRLFFEARPPGEEWVTIGAQRGALARNPVEAIPGDLVLLGRVVGLLRGVCASLGAPLSPMQMLRPFAERALAAEREASAASGGNG